GAVLALKSAEVGIKLPGKILDKWIDVVATWFRDRSPAVAGSASLRAAATPLELVSGERYELDTRATYRSVVDSDRTEGGEAATMVELIETFHNGWTAFRELVASLPDV